ncbi:sulfotransferase [Candidatus Aminicenantes bacterium AC-334-K16]|nr:sulfotransferase [Candidatus Aminicenantes bacterium AC-334-K16]
MKYKNFEMRQRKSIVYIAGYGRSGSTLLERILNSHDQVFGTGELASLLSLLKDDLVYCSCGQPIQKCSIWRMIISVIKKKIDNKNNMSKIQFQIESIFFPLRFLFISRKLETYKNFIITLLKSIIKYSGNPDFIIDSSKTARNTIFRPFILNKVLDMDVKVIHLVRDGRGCMWSYLKGSNRKIEKGENAKIPFAALRAVLGWVLSNMGAHLYQLFYPNKYCRIRYEDLVDFPTREMKKIEEFLGIDFNKQIEILKRNCPIPLGHQIAGNRLRFQKLLIINNDLEWQQKLSIFHKLLFWFFAWPLAIFYGYKFKS